MYKYFVVYINNTDKSIDNIVVIMEKRIDKLEDIRDLENKLPYRHTSKIINYTLMDVKND